LAVIRAALDFCAPGSAHIEESTVALPGAGELPAWAASWQQAVLSAYDLRADDARLRASLISDPSRRAAAFDQLRKEYPERREFSAWRCGKAPRALAQRLGALGFAG
jgi:erythronate-4-phosphate dehydrogenase